MELAYLSTARRACGNYVNFKICRSNFSKIFTRIGCAFIEVSMGTLRASAFFFSKNKYEKKLVYGQIRNQRVRVK